MIDLGAAWFVKRLETARLRHHVSSWVTPTAYEQGYYEKLYRVLQQWLATEFSFWKPYYSNAEIPR